MYYKYEIYDLIKEQDIWGEKYSHCKRFKTERIIKSKHITRTKTALEEINSENLERDLERMLTMIPSIKNKSSDIFSPLSIFFTLITLTATLFPLEPQLFSTAFERTIYAVSVLAFFSFFGVVLYNKYTLIRDENIKIECIKISINECLNDIRNDNEEQPKIIKRSPIYETEINELNIFS